MGEADFFAIFLCLAFILCNLSLAVEDQESTCEGPECDEEFQKQWRLPPRVDGVKVRARKTRATNWEKKPIHFMK